MNKDGEQKFFKQFGLFSVTLLLLSSSLPAQSFEDFKKTQNSSFTAYKDANDKVFNKFLQEQWKEYTGKKSKPLYEKQKPKSITPALQKKIVKIGPPVIIKIQKPKIIVEKKIVAEKLVVKKEKTHDIYLSYFGQEIGFDIDDKFKNAKFYPLSQKGVSNFFNTLAMSDYEETIREIKSTSKALNLNDWGVYELVNLLSQSLFSNNDDRKLFSWFIFNKLGYEVKIGLSGKHIIAMYYSKKIIYSTPSYTFKKKKFYVISYYAKGSIGRVYTYKQDYPGANKPLDLSLTSLPNFQKNLQHKTVSFKEFGKEYSSSYSYDKNLIDFMATYPQADYDTYFNAPLSEGTYDQIAKDIKHYVDGEKSSVAINFVLRFVQKAFKYERDQAQFGREKVMFANETLYYNKSDCEDRAILFSTLVKRLFHISVIGVRYKDHMTTALYIPMKGDSVKEANKRFVIADPTYINANIGQSMPKYKSKIPQDFIVVRKGS